MYHYIVRRLGFGAFTVIGVSIVVFFVLRVLPGDPLVAIFSAMRPNSVGDNISSFLSIVFLAIPGFWFGRLSVLASLFWFGYRAPLAGPSLLADPWANLQIVIGPGVVLTMGQAAYIARMARSSL